jgi:hypothetical protein
MVWEPRQAYQVHWLLEDLRLKDGLYSILDDQGFLLIVNLLRHFVTLDSSESCWYLGGLAFLLG